MVHNYIAYNYIGHNYIAHNYVAGSLLSKGSAHCPCAVPALSCQSSVPTIECQQSVPAQSVSAVSTAVPCRQREPVSPYKRSPSARDAHSLHMPGHMPTPMSGHVSVHILLSSSPPQRRLLDRTVHGMPTKGHVAVGSVHKVTRI